VKLAVVTCYFNALGVKSRLTNFEIFAARLKKQKVPLFVIEALFPGQKSSLAHFANVTTVECESVLWQKESLLNLLVRKLDTKFTGIVWCDADVILKMPSGISRQAGFLKNMPSCSLLPKQFACRAVQGAT
jgi:hypothetical protein